MTMILLFEAIQEKNLKWDDVLTCSAYASSMGGSQVYLEENETMSVFELLNVLRLLQRMMPVLWWLKILREVMKNLFP